MRSLQRIRFEDTDNEFICRAKASASKDVEAGEKKELLDDEEDDEEDSNKKAKGGGDEDGDDAVKVAGEKKGDVENGDEDDDAEKGALVESPGKKSQVRSLSQARPELAMMIIKPIRLH